MSERRSLWATAQKRHGNRSASHDRQENVKWETPPECPVIDRLLSAPSDSNCLRLSQKELFSMSNKPSQSLVSSDRNKWIAMCFVFLSLTRQRSISASDYPHCDGNRSMQSGVRETFVVWTTTCSLFRQRRWARRRAARLAARATWTSQLWPPAKHQVA